MQMFDLIIFEEQNQKKKTQTNKPAKTTLFSHVVIIQRTGFSINIL